MSQPYGSVEKAPLAGAVEELCQSYAGPGHITDSRAEKEERKQRRPQKDATGIRLVNEVCLAYPPVPPRVCLLRVQQRFPQQHCARDIISTRAQQMSLQHQRIVVDKPCASQSLLVGITL